MSLLVRGTVVEVEHNGGTFDDGKTWTTRHAVIASGTSVERVKLTREMEEPAEGAEVEIVVGLQLKQNARNLLQPFRLDLIAVEVTNLGSGEVKVPAARRAAKVA